VCVHGEQGVRGEHLFAVDSGERLLPELRTMEVGIRDAFAIAHFCTLCLKLLITQTPIMFPSIEYDSPFHDQVSSMHNGHNEFMTNPLHFMTKN